MRSIGTYIYDRRIMLLLFLSVLITGCEDHWESSRTYPEEGDLTDVSLDIGIANERDGAYLYSEKEPVSKSAEPGTFEVKLVPDKKTKVGNNVPDQLYNLEVCQYDENGIFKLYKNLGTIVTGSSLNLSLNTLAHCQLVFLVRGQSGAVPSINGKSLAAVKEVVATASVVDGLTDLNNMPYVLHIKDVTITDGKIQNPSGEDVRILLKRLAVKLKLNWTLSTEMIQNKYSLKEVRLCQVPKDYRILPASENSEWGDIYPVASAEFIDKFRLTQNLTDANGKGGNEIWLPANVRGSSVKATSALYRTKENAPSGATYLEMVVDNAEKKERLYYRVYLGGVNSTDFNLYENTDYTWIIHIGNANYVADPRIQLLDQTPVVSTNLVPTANSFMMKPGTNLCFNPYKHTAGTNGWNDYLVATPEATPSIKTTVDKVQVYWQTKDAGTVGDLIMGYVIDDNHHENLVNISEGGNLNDARVSVKVPLTKGGNALLVGYAGGTIVWSWHIWVTNYEPRRITNYTDYTSAQQTTGNGTVHKYDSPLFHPGGVYEKMVMMDRDLGARKGGFPGITLGDNFSVMDVVNTYGLLYQWGRKDPFPSSLDGTTNEKDVIYDGYGNPKNVGKIKTTASTATIVQNPLVFYTGYGWASVSKWSEDGAVAPGVKTIYDPCPDGWKVPVMFAGNNTISENNIEANSIFTNFGKLSNGSYSYNSSHGKSQPDYNKFLFYNNGTWVGSTSIADNANPKGGRLFLIGSSTLLNKTIHSSVWIPANVERIHNSGNLTYAGRLGHMWTAPKGYFMGYWEDEVQVNTISTPYGWPVRCIQDNP